MRERYFGTVSASATHKSLWVDCFLLVRHDWEVDSPTEIL